MESFLKKYNAEELTVLAKIPRLYRNKRAYQYMQDIIRINPDKVSKANLNHLIKHQLSEAIICLSAEDKLKKGDKLLTREERKLYDAILKTRWTLKHITFDYGVIKDNGNVLKSLQQRARENCSLDNSHALQETGKDDNVFFTLGSPNHKGAGFLAGQGGHVISLDVLERDKTLSGMQLSDHWFQYMTEGNFSQTYGNTRRDVKFYNDKEAAFTLKGHKVYSYRRHNGTTFSRTVTLGQETVTGPEVLPFIAYNLILELRYIGGQYRQHLFSNLEQREIIEAAIDSFYHSSNFEVTVPSQIDLNGPHITITPQDTNPANTVYNARLMHEAISERHLDKIETLLADGVSVDIKDEKGITPLVKALSTCRYNIAYFLIDSGANLELRYRNYSPLTIAILAGRLDIVEKIISKKIVIDERDGTIFRQVDINRDINAISAGISKGYLSYFLSARLDIKKFFPYIMFLLTEGILSEKIAIYSINLLLQPEFQFDYGKNKRSDHYLSLTLLNAIHQQKFTLIENLIKWGCKLDASLLFNDHQWFGVTPLMMAVTSGNMEIVKMLVTSGANIYERDRNGRTPATLAEEMKYQDIVKILKSRPHGLKNNAIPHKKEIAKALVYRKSSKYGDIHFLLGQKRNKKNYEMFSLDSSHPAWEAKSLEQLADKAVSKGALIDLVPHISTGNVQKKLFYRHDFRKSNTDVVIETHEYFVGGPYKLKPYPSEEYRDVKWIRANDILNKRYLISKYDYPMIESLIKNQPFTNHTYFRRLLELNAKLLAAVQQNSFRTVEKLLAAGADANSLNGKNLTPLAIACDTPHPNLRLIRTLIQNGALVSYACCYEARACDTHNPNLQSELHQILVQNDKLFNDICFYEMGGLVPLQLALLHKSKPLVRLLCENGANLNQKLGRSTTPLVTACGLEDIELIEILISHGAHFETDENKGILAMMCAKQCTDNLFDYLLDHANVNGLSAQLQYTPLMACAKLGDMNRIKKLLSKGADPSLRHPRTFKSAFDLAVERKMKDVINLLREHEATDKSIEKVLPAEDNTEKQKHKTKMRKTLVNRSLLRADIFNKTADFGEAFIEFYDKNSDHLRLFKERGSNKILNVDNEAVHLLLGKFSDVAHSGTKEERELVKGFFLNRTDHRDLFHLQELGPVILPYHIPYVKFVMEEEYNGKEFQLFSLRDKLQFYYSPDVSFYHEAPVQTWLKIVRLELPYSDLSIDALIATIILLDSFCCDKRVIESVFEQYIDTFDQQSVLKEEVTTLVRLVLTFFKSSASVSLKKSLLDKLNWNQLSEKNCHLTIENIIFLYRIHDTTLKFPSLGKQKWLSSLLMAKIKNISLVNYKIALLEQLMFTKNGRFNSPLLDGVFYNEVAALWDETILIKYGADDASYAYYHAMKKVIDRINNEASTRDKRHLFQQLETNIETQSSLSAYIGDINSRQAAETIQEKNVAVTVLGNALKMISQTEVDKIKTFDFLSSPLTAMSLDIIVDRAMTTCSCRELVKVRHSYGDDYSQYNKKDIANSFRKAYHHFWDLDIGKRAGVINYLLTPNETDLSLKDKEEAYNQIFHYAVHRLFPNAQSDEQEGLSKVLLIAYLQTVKEYRYEYLLAVLLTVLNEADSELKVSSPGHKFVLLCRHLGPAYVKLAQAILSHPKPRKNIYPDLEDHIKGCWNLWRSTAEVLPPHTAKVGGFRNKFLLKNHGKSMVSSSSRDENASDATTQTVQASEQATLQPHQNNTLRRIAEAAELQIIDMHKDCGGKLVDILHLDLKIAIQVENNLYLIGFAMNTTLSTRREHRFLDRTWNSESKDQPNITNQDKIVSKAPAIIKIQLDSKSAGCFCDCDRLGNQLRVKALKSNTTGLGLFDFGDMSIKKTGPIEWQQFANVLHSLLRDSRASIQCTGLTEQSVQPITCSIRRTSAATKKYLFDTDFIELLKSIGTHNRHPLSSAEISYIISKMSSNKYRPMEHDTSQLNQATSFGSFETTVKLYDRMKPQPKNTLRNKQVFVVIALRNLASKQRDAYHYANILVNSLKEQYGDNISLIPAFKDETSLYQQTRLCTPKGAEPILHMIVDVGFMLTPERLQEFKDEGSYVVTTVIGFAKHSERKDFNLKSDTLTLLEKSDYALFLNENDRKCAIEMAENLRMKIPPSQAVSAFAPVHLANKALEKRGKDIIWFGIIREGKGLTLVRKLAKLMKESDDFCMQGKILLVVGTVDQGQDKWNKTLHSLILDVYPAQTKATDKKKPNLITLLKEIQSDPEIKPALPIELHLNVSEKESSKLFDRCTYSYLPAYEGVTLHDYSVSMSLRNQFVTYAHEGKFTPEYLKVGGLYQDAISMIQCDPEKAFYSYSAETVLADIVRREKDPKLNIKTAQAASKLVIQQLSLSKVTAFQHDEIYSKGISLKTMKTYPFYYLPDSRSLTIPRQEMAHSPPKRYLGFHRLSQTLRHISSAVCRTVKIEYKCNPKEVQAAMLVDKLHVSSNFHSDKLTSALLTMMTQDKVLEKMEYKARWKRDRRHLVSLKQNFLNDPTFDAIVGKGIEEMKQGLGVPQHSNLSVEETMGQFVFQMKALRSVLQRVTNGNVRGVLVHPPPREDAVINELLKEGETATRHAERNIVQYLTDHAECLYNQSLDCLSLSRGKHVLVPMEGRFVPCGFCYEQEAVEQMEGGLFDPIQGKFRLHRSSSRAGKFFAREIQFFTSSSFHSDPVQAHDRSVKIIEAIANSSPQLNTYGRPVVVTSFLNTDSEDSSDEDQMGQTV